MHLSRKLLGPAIVGALGMGLAGNASAIVVDGIEFSAGSVFSVGTVFEDYVENPGDELSGIGTVDVIRDSDNNPTWVLGDNGRELTYSFGGFILESIENFGGGATLYFSGGVASFYSDVQQNFTSGAGQANNLNNATDGNLWLSLEAAEQYGSCNALALVCFNGDDTQITLRSNIFGNLTGITNGAGFAFFDVTGGSAMTYFDTNTFNGSDIDADFSFSDDVAGSDYDLRGSMNAQMFAVAEPATLGLLGLGLVAVAGLGRRRRA